MKAFSLTLSIILFCLIFTSIAFSDDKGLTESNTQAATSNDLVERFASLPFMEEVKLSPSGDYIAYIRNEKEKKYLIAQPLYDKTFKILLGGEANKLRLNWYRWVNDKRLIVSVAYPSFRDGTPTIETRLIAISRDGSDLKNITSPTRFDVEQRNHHISQIQDEVISILPDDPDHILVELDLETPNYPGVYRVNINNGKKTRVINSKATIRDWYADGKGNVSVGLGLDETKRKIIYKDPHTNTWQTLVEFDQITQDPVWPLGLNNDGSILYVRAIKDGHFSIFAADLKNPKSPYTLLANDANVDINGSLIYSPMSRDAVGVYYRGSEGQYFYWDKKAEGFQLSIDKALPETANYISGFSQDETRYIVFSTATKVPGDYYVGDRKNKKLDYVGSEYPSLNENALAAQQRIEYRTRDGISIEGFVTFPPNQAKSNLPTIVLPHGGPESHDGFGFDYWAQFFAAKDFAVFQMNFRGSSGQGIEFKRQSRKNWGLKMQDDITDGVQWLVEQGIVDKERICIVGASYGGYAALMGTVKTPEMYRCAISYAGISDLGLFAWQSTNYINQDLVFAELGVEWSERDRLIATSPIKQVEKIHTPILLVHGEKDRVVPVSQSEKMANELAKQNKEYQLLILEDGSHDLHTYDQRIKLFSEMGRFVDSHLKK